MPKTTARAAHVHPEIAGQTIAAFTWSAPTTGAHALATPC